jgi:hypothetical protein
VRYKKNLVVFDHPSKVNPCFYFVRGGPYEKHIVKTQERFVRVGGLQVPFTERLTMFNAAVKRKLCEIADQEKKRGEKRGHGSAVTAIWRMQAVSLHATASTTSGHASLLP